MKLHEIKFFLNNLPESFNDFDVVNGEVGTLPGEKEGDEFVGYRVDKDIITLYVDEETKEVCMFHQREEEVKEVITKK